MVQIVNDIQAHGLIQPITLHDGMILDGRNRYAACRMAKVEPRFEMWSGNGSPTEWVLSVNLKRRQLSASQRAAVAVQALPMLEAEAKERLSKAGGNNKAGVEKIPQEEQGKSSDKAAALANRSKRKRPKSLRRPRRKSRRQQVVEGIGAGAGISETEICYRDLIPFAFFESISGNLLEAN